ncbi:MAG: hypothetical protein JXR76_30645 [Deltaproteobacteria bacterium]|nr:hypothetical protein [Deltaproteobacteria bacterium]
MRAFTLARLLCLPIVIIMASNMALAEDDAGATTANAQGDKTEATDGSTSPDEAAEDDAKDGASLPVFDMTGNAAAEGASDTKAPTASQSQSADGANPADSSQSSPEPATVVPPATDTKVPEKARPTNAPFKFGIGFAPGGEHGVGLVTRFRTEHISFDFSYGVFPVFSSTTLEKGDDSEAKFDFEIAKVHADGGLAIFFGDRAKGFQDGIRTQGIYDSIMGWGGGLGWTRERQCSRFKNKCWKHFVLGVGSGIKVYPQYQDRVRDYFDFSSNVKVSKVNIVQMYLGITLMWYP